MASKLESLHDLFIEELKDTYDAEHQITKALPKMIKAAQTPELRAAFEEHLTQTENQIARLEQVFGLLNEKPARKTCAGMKGIIAEGDEQMKEDMAGTLLDVALIASAQRVEHYEIAAYGTLCALSRQMGHEDCADLLDQTLEEETATDEKLTLLAEQHVNPSVVMHTEAQMAALDASNSTRKSGSTGKRSSNK